MNFKNQNYFFLCNRFKTRDNLRLAFNIEKKGYKPITCGRFFREDEFILNYRDYLIPKKDAVVSLKEKDYKKYLVLNDNGNYEAFLIKEPNYFYEYPNFYLLSLVVDMRPNYE